MTISNKMLLALLAFVAGAVGLSMYVGMRIGLEAAAPPAETTVAMTPAVATTPETPAATAASPATVTTDECAFLVAVASNRTEQADAGAPAGEVTIEEGDFATNSGIIDGSQFSDGGFGDIGQQWWGVTVNGNVTNVNVDSGGSANVAVGGGSTTPPPSTPVLAETPVAPVAPVVPAAPAPAPEPQAPAPAPATPPAVPEPPASAPELVPASAPGAAVGAG